MISVITAVHNQLDMNRLFFESLTKYSHHPFELIILDNASTDGSAEYFESVGAKVIRNPVNYSYPYCQNQGIDAAKYDFFAFLNNDIIVAPDWDEKLIKSLETNDLSVVTCCGIERTETKESTLYYGRRWKLIRNFLGVFGNKIKILKFMHLLMYGNWERFSEKRWERFGTHTVEGFVGNTVFCHRSAIEKVGRWDERIQAADFDLYIRCKKRSIEKGDIRPVHIVLSVFNHHFIRLTVKSRPAEFADKDKLIPLDEKWTKAELADYLKDNVFT